MSITRTHQKRTLRNIEIELQQKLKKKKKDVGTGRTGEMTGGTRGTTEEMTEETTEGMTEGMIGRKKRRNNARRPIQSC